MTSLMAALTIHRHYTRPLASLVAQMFFSQTYLDNVLTLVKISKCCLVSQKCCRNAAAASSPGYAYQGVVANYEQGAGHCTKLLVMLWYITTPSYLILAGLSFRSHPYLSFSLVFPVINRMHNFHVHPEILFVLANTRCRSKAAEKICLGKQIFPLSYIP